MDSHQLLNALRAILPEIGEDAAAQLAPLFSPRELARGEPLLRQGETWQQAQFIDSGLIRMHFLRRDGREFNKNFFAEGSLLCPLTPAMWQAPSLFGISCIEPTRVQQCDARQFREVLGDHGHWEPLQRILLERLLTGKLQREHDLLAHDGRQRYQTFCDRFPQLAERVPLGQLASYLGMTDVSLSRLRRELRQSTDAESGD